MLTILFATAALAAQDATIKTSDGVSLHALVDPVKGSKQGVVLVHQLGRDATDWTGLSAKLARSGLAVISPDLRKHGKSKPAGSTAEPTEADYAAMVFDVNASIAWLRSKGVTDISCVGASIGANLCVKSAAADPGVTNLVLLSPGLNYKGVMVSENLIAYGPRPVLLVASLEDSYSAKTVTVLEGKAQGQKHVAMLQDAGHGTKMFNRDSSLEGVVQSWLLGTYELANGEVVTPRPAVPTKVDEVKTSGKKLTDPN